MAVETLGEAYSYGWRVTARCGAAQAGWHAPAQGMRLPGRARPENFGVDARPSLSPLAAGDAVALPDVRLARGCAALYRPDRRNGGAQQRERVA
jgi:hypothetical protein